MSAGLLVSSRYQKGDWKQEWSEEKAEEKTEEQDEKEKSEERIAEAPKKIGEEDTIKR